MSLKNELLFKKLFLTVQPKGSQCRKKGKRNLLSGKLKSTLHSDLKKKKYKNINLRERTNHTHAQVCRVFNGLGDWYLFDPFTEIIYPTPSLPWTLNYRTYKQGNVLRNSHSAHKDEFEYCTALINHILFYFRSNLEMWEWEQFFL